MLETNALPTCDEYGSLDVHLDELEEPGTNYLQGASRDPCIIINRVISGGQFDLSVLVGTLDFIVAPQKLQSYTPLSQLNGYTSEESDYSVRTPSDEQNYQDMSFLHATNTGNLSTNDLTTVTLQRQQQKFVGKVMKRKTSKFRGVTQTSKTSWGAKYSAKRITNTCKTPEEAAHAYDEYLKTNHPLKYAKFANFCRKCGEFVNPLGFPQFQSECKCSSSPQAVYPSPENFLISPKKEFLTTKQSSTFVSATPSLTSPTAPSPAGPSTVSMPGSLMMTGTTSDSMDLTMNPAAEENTFLLSHRSSIVSVGSLKLSFLEDTEQFLIGSFHGVANMATNLDSVAIVDQQDEKRDSLPISIITSAVDSFTQESNLDQIIKDIDCSLNFHSLLKGNTAEMHISQGHFDSYSTTKSRSSGTMSDINSTGQIQVEPSAINSLDFGKNELDELTNCIMWENDAAAAVHRETQIHAARMQQNVSLAGRNPQLKKIHSLDFDVENSVTGSSSRSGFVVSEAKIEDTEMVNSIEANPVAASSGMMTPSRSPYPAMIDIQTSFLDKYWRNDRKNIQCFPSCPEHSNYYRVRIENLRHRCKGVCRAPVRAHVFIPALASASVAIPDLLVLARCNSTFSRYLSLTKQKVLSLPEIKELQAVSVVGEISNFAHHGTGDAQFDVTFHPDVWKFEFDLPKKRRHVQSSSSVVSLYETDGDVGGDITSTEFLYFFEIDVFYSSGKKTFERFGYTKSTSFQIGNTRTLLRQRNKLAGEMNSGGESEAQANDGDKLANADEIPEKKRVKVIRGRHEILPGTSFSEDGLSSRGLTGIHLSIGNITCDGVSSSSKRDLLEDMSSHLFDAEDSIYDREAGSSKLSPVKAEPWKVEDSEDSQLASGSDYFPYISPKPKSGSALIACSSAAAAIPIKAHPNTRPVIPVSPAKEEAPCLAKQLAYLVVCVPLSMLFIPVGIISLIVFLLIPPAASSIVSALDALSDMELSRANISCTPVDQRMVLKRLIEEKGDSAENALGGMYRYHVKGEVWGRIFYFSGAKFLVSIVLLIPAFVLALLARLLYPIRPASFAIAESACYCALLSREYTRKTMGIPFF